MKNVRRAEHPKPAEEMIAADPRVPVLGSELAERLARGAAYDFESTEYFRLILKLRSGMATVCDICGASSGHRVDDVAAVRLPEAIFPCYRIVRMGRLMWKVV